MIEIDRREGALYAYDRAGNAVTVGAIGWDAWQGAFEFDKRVDATVSGRASELRFANEHFGIKSLDGIDPYTDPEGSLVDEGYVPDRGETVDLPDSRYVLRLQDDVLVLLRFDGEARVERGERITVAFPRPTEVTVGFRSHIEYPRDTIRVDPTPEGLAEALTYASGTHRTTTADRSFPTMRGHPPRLEPATSTHVPEELREAKDDVGVEFRLPADLEHVFVAATLAYYLGAAVTVEDRDRPVLRAPDAGFEHRFSALPAFEDEVVAALRRVFYLDCLVRNAGPYGTETVELSAVQDSAVPLDIDTCYDLSLAERVARYFDLPFDPVAEHVPEWTHLVHVDPDAAHVPTLTVLLDRLGVALRPEGDPARPQAAGLRSPVVGWLASGNPGGAFKASTAAYQNQLEYVERSDETRTVAVVAGPDATDAGRAAADWYRDHSLPQSVTVSETHAPSRADLQDVLASEVDLLHYTGATDGDGFRCQDGTFVPDHTVARTFLLDAPDSVPAARRLVEAGGVTGIACHPSGSLGHAPTLGGFLVNGLCASEALGFARRTERPPVDATVVGDGAYGFQPGSVGGIAYELEAAGADVDSRANSFMFHHGALYYVGDGPVHLVRNTSHRTYDTDGFRDFVDEVNEPVLLNGTVYWPDEFDRFRYPLA